MNRVYDYGAIFRAIVCYKEQHDGNSPTLRELQRICGVSSTSVMTYILGRLEKTGCIRRTDAGIVVTGGRWRMEA